MVKGIKETGEKFEKASIKTVINSLKRFNIAEEFAKGKNLVENTIEWGGKNFKLKWEKGVKITFGDIFANMKAIIKYETKEIKRLKNISNFPL